MEDKLRALHTKSLELETQFQVEARGRRSAEEANRDLVTDAENARQSLRELQGKVGGQERSSKENQNPMLFLALQGSGSRRQHETPV